jgi:NADH dehydrogenase [ubiquinone] 1 alpha subcomplex assembly factor 1
MNATECGSKPWPRAMVALVLALVAAGGCADPMAPHADQIAERLAATPQTESVQLFTFDAPEQSDPWRIINDTVMGGRSSSRMEVTDRGTGVFSGTVSLDNNGGFAHTRSMAAPYDLSAYQGIVVRLRGDGKTYNLTLKLDRAFDGVMYQAGFPTRAREWVEVRLPFTDFVPTYHGDTLSDHPALNPSKIATIGFIIADKQAGSFRLEIDWIGAYAAGS